MSRNSCTPGNIQLLFLAWNNHVARHATHEHTDGTRGRCAGPPVTRDRSFKTFLQNPGVTTEAQVKTEVTLRKLNFFLEFSGQYSQPKPGTFTLSCSLVSFVVNGNFVAQSIFSLSFYSFQRFRLQLVLFLVASRWCACVTSCQK